MNPVGKAIVQNPTVLPLRDGVLAHGMPHACLGERTTRHGGRGWGGALIGRRFLRLLNIGGLLKACRAGGVYAVLDILNLHVSKFKHLSVTRYFKIEKTNPRRGA